MNNMYRPRQTARVAFIHSFFRGRSDDDDADADAFDGHRRRRASRSTDDDANEDDDGSTTDDADEDVIIIIVIVIIRARIDDGASGRDVDDERSRSRFR